MSNLSLSDSDSDIGASESSDRFPAQQHTLSLDIFDSNSGLSSSVSDSGSIVSKSSTSIPFFAPQQIPLLELSDSDSVLSFLTFNFIPRVPEPPVKLEFITKGYLLVL